MAVMAFSMINLLWRRSLSLARRFVVLAVAMAVAGLVSLGFCARLPLEVFVPFGNEIGHSGTRTSVGVFRRVLSSRILLKIFAQCCVNLSRGKNAKIGDNAG